MSTRSSAANARHCFLLFLLGVQLAGTATPAPAQVAPLAPKWLAGTPLPPVETFADGLTRHHIALTEKSLIDALSNPDGEVRSLAAAQLAASDDRSALVPILDAMEAESDLQVQVNLAGAASWLDSHRALEQLQRLCQNLNVPSTTRLDAARYVSNKQLPTCFASIEQIEQSARHPDLRILALETAATYRGQGDKAQALAVSALADMDPSVRIAAAQMLQTLHATSSSDALQRALQVEGDDSVRKYLRETIRALQPIEAPH